jgi:hypothetical protein
LDLCGHCIPRSSEDWQGVLGILGKRHAIDTTDASLMLGKDWMELACAGIGLDRLGTVRLNTYGRPVRPLEHFARGQESPRGGDQA